MKNKKIEEKSTLVVSKPSGSLPSVVNQTKVKKFRFTFLDSEIDAFKNASLISKKQKADYRFFLKLRRYLHINHFVHVKEPFSHVYEKQYWEMSFFDKVLYLMRKKFAPLNSSPFSVDGESVFFEIETLYSPQKCVAYNNRNYVLMHKNLRRFSKSFASINADVYEEILIDEIHEEHSGFKLKKFIFTGKEARFVKSDSKKDEVPDAHIDRHAWPSEFISKDVNISIKK